MTAILKAVGFKYIETLEQFSLKFSNLPPREENDFTRIIICHSTNPKNTDFMTAAESEDCYETLRNIFLNGNDSLENHFGMNLSIIFEKIFLHFNVSLTSYIVKKCFLFYLNEFDSIEILFKENYIHKKIKAYKNQHLPANSSKKISYQRDLDICLQQNDNFSQITTIDKFKPPRPLPVNSVKKVKKDMIHSLNLQNNPCCPMQEKFNLKKILYDAKLKPQWPKSHILSLNDADKLLDFIISLDSKCSPKIALMLLKQHQHQIQYKKFLKSFLMNHLKIDKNNGYGRILKRHLKNVQAPNDSALSLAPSLVSSYIIDILRRVIPDEFYSTKNMRKKFFSSVLKIVNGKLGEEFFWHPFLQIFLSNKNKLPWCGDVNPGEEQDLLILKTVKFLIIHYLFVLIKNNFYVTETGNSGRSLRFYEKSGATRAIQDHINLLIYNNRMKLQKRKDTDAVTVERYWIDTGSLNDVCRPSNAVMVSGTEFKQPIACVRFMPKSESLKRMRLITSFPPRTITKYAEPTRKAFQLVKLFERRVQSRKKHLFATKLFLKFLIEKNGTGIDPVPQNPKLEEAWKKAMAMKKTFGKIYFVKGDIADAFGSISHGKLLKILEKTIREVVGNEEFVRLRRISEWRIINGKIRKRNRFSFSDKLKKDSILVKRSDDVGKSFTSRYAIQELLSAIKQVAFEQRIRVQGKIFRLSKGLAQGSAGKFSPQLCEIYYSSMDRQYFAEYRESEDCVLLRGVDDYLLITFVKSKAESFLRTLTTGIASYNAKFSTRKLKTNLFGKIDGVRYLGLMFDFEDESVKPDYSKYEGMNFLSMMKSSDARGDVHFNKRKFLEIKLRRMSNLKLQPILIGHLNDVNVVRKTVFQACVVQTLKVMTLVEYLNPKCTDYIKADFLFESCRKLKVFLRRRKCKISDREVTWLFFKAVATVLRKRSGRFKELPKIMRYQFKNWEAKWSSRRWHPNFNELKKIFKNSSNCNSDCFLKCMLNSMRK